MSGTDLRKKYMCTHAVLKSHNESIKNIKCVFQSLLTLQPYKPEFNFKWTCTVKIDFIDLKRTHVLVE